MNPWLEQRWADVHSTLIVYLREELGTELPDDLTARAEEHVTLSTNTKVRPDVAVVEDSWKSGKAPRWRPGPSPLAATPVYIMVDEPVDRWLEISTADGEIVTVIEILSPANKSVNRDDYRKKRDAYLEENINLVEIDLLLDGKRVFEFPIDSPPSGQRVDYAIAVRRRDFPGRREVYPVYLRDPIPSISIPLRTEDEDVIIDLQKLINRAYETGRYWKTNYTSPVYPPLSPEDESWAKECIASAQSEP